MTIIYNGERAYVPVEANAFDALEEALYILYELTPYDRDWKHQVISSGTFYADYHCLEFVKVTLGEDDTVYIEDCVRPR